MATFAGIHSDPSFGFASYAAYRPTYPTNLYDMLMTYHQGPKKLCVDLGCGPGIATRDLSMHFDHVVGVDPSAGMVEKAQQSSKQLSNCKFRQGAAESLPFLKDGEVDCITAAEAAHWFDHATLWPEMRRVVRKGGTMAFWIYTDPELVDFPKAAKIMRSFMDDADKLGPYWEQPGESYLQDMLRVVQPPREDWEDIKRIEYQPGFSGQRSGEGTLLMNVTISIYQWKQIARTWSSYHVWKEAHPGQVARSEGQEGEGDILDQMFDEIAATEEHFRDDKNMVNTEYPTAVIMARRR